MRLTAQTKINRAPEDVFAYLANRTNLPQWSQGVGSVRKLTKEAVGAGSRFRIEAKGMGRLLPSVYEITAYEAPAMLAGKNTGLLSFVETFELAKAGVATEVVQSAEVALGTRVLFLAPLLRLALGSQLRKDLETLKRVLEALPVAAPGSEPAAE
jgi:hypothetical protein